MCVFSVALQNFDLPSKTLLVKLISPDSQSKYLRVLGIRVFRIQAPFHSPPPRFSTTILPYFTHTLINHGPILVTSRILDSRPNLITNLRSHVSHRLLN